MLVALDHLASRDNQNPGDYQEDGLLMCGKCHTPKQRRQMIPAKIGKVSERLVPVYCRCELEELERDKARMEMQEFRSWMRSLNSRFSVPDDTYQRFTF